MRDLGFFILGAAIFGAVLAGIAWPTGGKYQTHSAGGAVGVIWRLNTVDGSLELCFAANYSAWIDGAPLTGRCDGMPMPAE